MVLLCDQGCLATAYDKQLLVISLVQADTDWQVQTHPPIFHLAGESAVHGIDDEDDECEDVDHEHGREHQGDISHAEDGMFSVQPGEEACPVEEERIEDNEDYVGDAIAIKVL